MTKFDEKLSRMEFLMGYRMPLKENKKNNIEYHTEGADGKVYGILKEGNMYYIKTTEKGKETLAESYEYIGGYNYRNENGFNSYNQATKILEQKMMALNESYGVHKDVSTVDFNRGEKLLEGLTKEARKELDRVKLIMENSMGIKDNIGNHGNPEGKGTSTGAQTEKNNDPFTDKKDEQLKKDDVATETDPKKANSDYTDASKNVESQMTSDKAPKKATDSGDPNKDYTLTHDDLDGDGVADKNPKGAKAVMVNEGLEDTFDDVVETPVEDFQDDVPYEDNGDINQADFGVEPSAPADGGLVGTADEQPAIPAEPAMEQPEEDDFDALMEEFKERIAGDDEALTGPHGSLEVQTDEHVEECTECKAEEKQEALDGPKGNGEVLTMDRLSESQKKQIDSVVNGVVEKLFEGKKPSNSKEFEDAVRTIVKEEMQEWGKHPKYGEEPMTTPPNTEVLKGTADRDFNDDSAKGNERYGKKIGNGQPFDKAVEILTDSVMAVLKEALSVKKK